MVCNRRTLLNQEIKSIRDPITFLVFNLQLLSSHPSFSYLLDKAFSYRITFLSSSPWCSSFLSSSLDLQFILTFSCSLSVSFDRIGSDGQCGQRHSLDVDRTSKEAITHLSQDDDRRSMPCDGDLRWKASFGNRRLLLSFTSIGLKEKCLRI